MAKIYLLFSANARTTNGHWKALMHEGLLDTNLYHRTETRHTLISQSTP